MQIIIDAAQQAPHITGTDRLAHNVLRELQTLDTENHYIVLCTTGFDYIPSVITAPNFKVVRQRLFRRQWKIVVAPWRMLVQGYRKYVERPDLYFSFHNMATPRIKFAPTVSSALDLIPLVFSAQYHPDATRAKMYKRRLQHTCKTADYFVAISKHTKQDLQTYLDVPGNKVTVMPLAAEAKFSPETTARRLDDVRAKYKLPRHFIATIGANEPRKNAAGVIEAYQKLPDSLRTKYSLAVMGEKWLNRPVEETGSKQIMFTGFVDDEDLPVIYSLADAFVFLSTYEGFGLPVLEAMSCNTPVICANNSSLPEVAGDAAILVDAGDTAACAQAIRRVLEDPAYAGQLAQAGLNQAKHFNWTHTAEILLSVFKKALSQQSAQRQRHVTTGKESTL
ncbi:MAG TPA: glycosyltransferase family 1 protein [Candidatus Polarisedimenticolaceae bacterium]|nr:glycosyltransferase family 1 protein [Candidatus Polarisedimenticolaceae bacterium]